MPEWAFGCYERMRPRLEAEETRGHVNRALFTAGRAMADSDRTLYERGLDEATEGAPQRIPAATRGFLRRAGIRMRKGGE